MRRKLSRRKFLRLTAATAVGAALLPRAMPAFSTTSVLDGTGLSLPCAAGDVNEDSAVIWLRAQRENLLAIEYGTDPAFQSALKSTPIRVVDENDYTGKILLTNLVPHSVIYYRSLVSGMKPGPIQRFVTAPRRDQESDVCFAFSGDTRHAYQPFNIMDAMREQKPDFFLHLGDTVYADREGRARRLAQFREKYVENRRDGPTQRLFAETSVLVVWDDHEVADNFRATDPLAPVGRRAFMDFWPVHQDPSDSQRFFPCDFPRRLANRSIPRFLNQLDDVIGARGRGITRLGIVYECHVHGMCRVDCGINCGILILYAATNIRGSFKEATL